MFWLDLSASLAGCYTDTDRTISVGEPSRERREIYEVAARCIESSSRGRRARA